MLKKNSRGKCDASSFVDMQKCDGFKLNEGPFVYFQNKCEYYTVRGGHCKFGDEDLNNEKASN